MTGHGKKNVASSSAERKQNNHLNHFLLGIKEKRKKENGECKQHTFLDYNVTALFANASRRVFLIGLERKVGGSDPTNKNKRRLGGGMKKGILYAGHHVSLHRSSD